MIQSVEKQYDRDNKSFIYKITMTDNTIMFVPHDEANRHYQEILEWVAAGNTITDPGA
jgi:hypothetical protein